MLPLILGCEGKCCHIVFYKGVNNRVITRRENKCFASEETQLNQPTRSSLTVLRLKNLYLCFLNEYDRNGRYSNNCSTEQLFTILLCP